ncbi:MAG: T9SS type A sorting domain-containing protein [candidate division Zixibacteria bacterium]|nr:T9SS type A sorting domain-containing protein [candidate division Zixibacteria bacterium]
MVLITNCTISHNLATEGGGLELRDSDVTITNTIISFSGQGEAISVRGDVTVGITYSDIYGNAGGDWIGPIADQLGINGNICDDPLFVDAANNDFELTANSVCIDAGDPDSPLDPDGTISDLGAYYYHQMTDILDDISSISREITLSQNYPNPFNAITSIRYYLPVKSNVAVDIFDLLGQKVVSIIAGEQGAGEHSLTWNANDQPSGIYFYRIQAGDNTEIKAITLIK